MKRLALVALLASSAAIAHPIRIELPQRHDAEDTADGIAKLTAALRIRDGKAIAKLLATPIDHGALWFPDAACTKRYGKIGQVDAKELEAFARCLATLDLITTTRSSAMPFDTVLTYKPGVEVELGFSRGKVAWIGDHAIAEDAVPMLTAQAFEALRTAGTTNLDAAVAAKLDPIVAKTGPLSSWLRVCVDPKAVVTTTVVSASTVAGEAFRAAVADWAFRPFEHRGTAIRACSHSLLTYPAAKAPAVEQLPPVIHVSLPSPDDPESPYEFDFDGVQLNGVPAPQNIPPAALEALRLTGTKSITPEPATTAEIVKAGKPRIVGSFKVCIGTTGFVTSVTVVKSTGYSAYDQKLQREMRLWRFKPYVANRQPVAVCTAETFIYKP